MKRLTAVFMIAIMGAACFSGCKKPVDVPAPTSQSSLLLMAEPTDFGEMPAEYDERELKEREKFNGVVNDYREDADKMLVENGRCDYGYKSLVKFKSNVDEGRSATLEYALYNWRYTAMRGRLVHIAPEDRELKLGRLEFDGEKIICSVTKYGEESPEYTVEGTALKCENAPGVRFGTEESIGCDRIEKWRLLGGAADDERGLLFSIERGWGLDEELRSELMRFSSDWTADEILTELKRDGRYVISEDLRCTAGYERIAEFQAAVDEGKPATLLVAEYNTLDATGMSPELYEQEKDNYPMISVCIVHYDGEAFTHASRYGTEGEGFAPSRLKHFKTEQKELRAEGVKWTHVEHYYLVNDPTKTQSDIDWLILSSSLETRWFPHASVLTLFFE